MKQNKTNPSARLRAKKSKKSQGAISSVFLILAVVLLILIVVIFVVIKISASKTTPTKTPISTSQSPTPAPAPVYDTTVGNVRFLFEDAQDLGSVLQSNSPYQPNLTTTERFIKVTIGAQNVGKLDTQEQAWALGNIIDSDGRNFVSIDGQISNSLPSPNLCGAILKPAFAPTPCISFYEVARASTSLKLEVNYTDANSGKKKESFLDLQVSQ